MEIKAAFKALCTELEKSFPVIIEPLLPGASIASVEGLEKRLECRVPSELRELWNLSAGTGENAFFGFYFFHSPGEVFQDDVLMFVEDNRETQGTQPCDAHEEELASKDWIPFASQGYADGLAICVPSGRVFSWSKGDPMKLVGNTLGDYISAYAARIRDGSYLLEEGFSTDHDYYLVQNT